MLPNRTNNVLTITKFKYCRHCERKEKYLPLSGYVRDGILDEIICKLNFKRGIRNFQIEKNGIKKRICIISSIKKPPSN